MNKEKYNKVVKIIVKILVVIAIINGVIIGGSVITFTVLFIKSFSTVPRITDEEIMLKQKQRLEEVKNHLEKKYEKKFVINPDGTDGGGSPIPFSSGYYTVTYEAYAEDDPDFYFNVDVVPMSIHNNEIKEIRDSYCWKFLREKLNNEAEKTLSDNFDGDCKLLIRLSHAFTFENYIEPQSSMEDYFNGSGRKPNIVIYLFTNESNKQLEVKTEQKIMELLNRIKDKSKNVSIEFRYYVIKDSKDFEKIDILKEDLRLYNSDIDKTYKPFRDMDKEKKIQVTIDTNDR